MHCHQNVEYLRDLTQQGFVIVKFRTSLRILQTMCATCRWHRAPKFRPMMTDYLKKCVAFGYPSSYSTGRDCSGQFYLSVKLWAEKRWKIPVQVLNYSRSRFRNSTVNGHAHMCTAFSKVCLQSIHQSTGSITGRPLMPVKRISWITSIASNGSSKFWLKL